MNDPERELMQLFLEDDHASVSRLLSQQKQLCTHLNDGVFDWNMPPLAASKSREMVDVLIDHGANVEKVTEWWTPGFGADRVLPDVARHLVDRGAKLSIHAAVAIGLADVVDEMLGEDARLVAAKGGDGCTPLHFCKDIGLAASLLAHGAEIDAKDEDHESTPAQWRIGDAPDVARWLLDHGAKPDIFMSAAFGDLPLTRQLVTEEPVCTSFRIGNNRGPFPGIGFQERGGTIYQWSLGFNLSPHEVALRRQHLDVYDFLLAHSAPRTQLLVACTTANRELAESIVSSDNGLVSTLDAEDLALMAKFCWETNKDIEAVRLMLDVGFPVDALEFNHGYSALHNAAWCGDPDLVRLLLDRGHPADIRDPHYDSTALGYAVHSCIEAKRHPDGDFATVTKLLLEAGTPFDPKNYPVGDEAIDEVIKSMGRDA